MRRTKRRGDAKGTVAPTTPLGPCRCCWPGWDWRSNPNSWCGRPWLQPARDGDARLVAPETALHFVTPPSGLPPARVSVIGHPTQTLVGAPGRLRPRQRGLKECLAGFASDRRAGDYAFAPQRMGGIVREKIDTSIIMFGDKLPRPSRAEIATAQAAAKSGGLLCVSSASTATVEEIGKVTSGPKWFQMYLMSTSRSRGRCSNVWRPLASSRSS